MAQLVQGKRKIIFTVDMYDVSITSNTVLSARHKIEHDLHINVCKVGGAHIKNVPQSKLRLTRIP